MSDETEELGVAGWLFVIGVVGTAASIALWVLWSLLPMFGFWSIIVMSVVFTALSHTKINWKQTPVVCLIIAACLVLSYYACLPYQQAKDKAEADRQKAMQEMIDLKCKGHGGLSHTRWPKNSNKLYYCNDGTAKW